MSCFIRRVAALCCLAALLAALTTFNPTGASAAPGATCGGFIGSVLCGGKGEFCQFAPGQCTGLLPGACATAPQMCTARYQPVCGCNNKTYSNDCKRMQAKVSKLHDGRCKS